jgi:nucleoid-associated protein YgaU
VTPAVVAAGLFAAACAVIAITFVAARGGLQMPIAPTAPAVALATSGATSPEPSTPPTFAAPTLPGTPAPSVLASAAPTFSTSSAPPSSTGPGGQPTLDPSDPLLKLPGCPGLPGCFAYTIQRGDSLSGIASRYLVPVLTVLALNPEITDPSVVVVGHVLYLGRDPFVRLPACPATPDCSLYTVKAGDRLSTIAGRFGITLDVILAVNPSITDPSLITSGQVIRLPHPTN